jgi:ABC-type lipoprotein release transport system permease subunit
MNLLSLALRNVLRYWHRTLVTTLAMAFAGIIMILFAALMEGLMQASERNAVAMNLGDIQIHAPGYRDDPDLYTRIEHPQVLLERLRAAGFRASARLYGFGLAASGSTSAGVQLRGIDPRAEAGVTQVHRHLLHGQWLDSAERDGVVVGRKLARTLGVSTGDEVVIVSQASDGSIADALFRVRGVLKSVGEGVDRAGFYLLDTAFRELMAVPQGAHEIAVLRTDRSADLDAATAAVAALAPGYETLDWRALQPVIARILELADAQLVFMLLIVYVAVGMVVLNAMLMSVFERIHEFGVMKAIGVTPWQISALVFMETLAQVSAACLLALVLGWWSAHYFQLNGIDLSGIASAASIGGVALDPVWYARITPDALLVPVAFLLLIALLAVIYPAVKAAVIRPVAALHYR